MGGAGGGVSPPRSHNREQSRTTQPAGQGLTRMTRWGLGAALSPQPGTPSQTLTNSRLHLCPRGPHALCDGQSLRALSCWGQSEPPESGCSLPRPVLS